MVLGSVDVAQPRNVLESELVATKVTVSPRSNVPPPVTWPRSVWFADA